MDNFLESSYAVLGIGRHATHAEIKARYLRLLQESQPENFSDPADRSEKQLEYERLQQAYEILKDKNVREGEEISARAKDSDRIQSSISHGSDHNSSQHFGTSGVEVSRGTKSVSFGGPPSDAIYDTSSEDEEQRGPRRQREDQRRRIERDIEERNERARKQWELNEITGDELSRDEPQEDQEPHSPDEQNSSRAEEKKLLSVPVTQLGMRVMSSGLVTATVDIVAVHGLGAIPDITWKESKSGVNWLSDPQMLPSRTPEARILRFGYDSLWLGKEAIRTRLPTIADKLLLVLARERQQDPMRPLVFIGHCFGGLVVQRALITAKLHPESETEEAILKSTVGAVFLGTPHRGTGAFGSQSALLAAIAAQSTLSLSMESDVLEAMKAERGELLDVSEDFLKLSVRENLRITCFFEQRESNLGKMIGRDDIKQFVVDETSAKLGANRAIGLPTDHFKLNKFAAPEDGNYLDVAGEVVRLYTEALKLANERSSSRRSSAGDLDQYRRLVAKQELKLEEAAKEAALKEEEFEKRFRERLEKNVLLPKDDVKTGKQQGERLKRNMRRYGLGKRDVRHILQDNPTPNVEDSSLDNVQERDQWYQNSLKGALFEAGLEEGEVDAIIHDAGETMVIEGVRTSVTRMSERWLDERTLRRYDIPFMRDPAQHSALIIKRWVPLYEKEFLWDHSQELRTRVSRPKREDTTSPNRPRTRDGSRRNRSADSIRSNLDRSSILRRRRASTESILSPPNSHVITRRRNNSRTLQEQNRSRQSSADSVRRPVLEREVGDRATHTVEEEETNTSIQEDGSKVLVARNDAKTRKRKTSRDRGKTSEDGRTISRRKKRKAMKETSH